MSQHLTKCVPHSLTVERVNPQCGEVHRGHFCVMGPSDNFWNIPVLTHTHTLVDDCMLSRWGVFQAETLAINQFV